MKYEGGKNFWTHLTVDVENEFVFNEEFIKDILSYQNVKFLFLKNKYKGWGNDALETYMFETDEILPLLK